MKTEPILKEVEMIKDHLADQAGGDLQRFLEQMDAWLEEHPHPGPVVRSPEELRERVKGLEAGQPSVRSEVPYKAHDPIIAEVHRVRERLESE